MEQTILGKTVDAVKKEIKLKILLCVIVALVCLAINLTLLLTYTRELHALFLTLSILIDVAGSWFVFAYVSLVILPKQRLCDLSLSRQEKLSGVVREISEETQKISRIDCRLVKLDDRTVFLPTEGKITLKIGDRVVFYLVNNITVGVDYE